MEKLKNILSVIFYLIWIPLGLLLIAGIVFLIVANPFRGIGEMMSGDFPEGPGGDFGQSGPDGFQPTEEMMRQFIEQDEPPDGGDFGPPSQ